MKKNYIHLLVLTLLPVFVVTTCLKAPGKPGFIPLTDCAPLMAAKELGLSQKYGVQVAPDKGASWANIRAKVLNGKLDGKMISVSCLVSC